MTGFYDIRIYEIDNLDADTNWTASGCTITIDTVNKKKGTGCFDIDKTNAASTTCYIKYEGSFDLSAYEDYYLRLYSKPQDTTIEQITVRLYQGGSDYNDYELNPTQDIWNIANKVLSSPDSVGGGGVTDWSAITEIRIIIETTAVDDLPQDTLLDYLILAAPESILLGDTYIDLPRDYKVDDPTIEVANYSLDGNLRRVIMNRKIIHTLSYKNLAADCYSYIKAERDRDEVIQFMWGAFDIDTMVHVYMSKREILPGTIYLSNIEIILLEES